MSPITDCQKNFARGRNHVLIHHIHGEIHDLEQKLLFAANVMIDAGLGETAEKDGNVVALLGPGLEPWRWEHTDGKESLIRGYRTQVDALFPDGRIPLGPETYFEPG